MPLVLGSLKLILPYPPSVNNMHRNGKGRRFSTDQYKSWKTAAGWTIREQAGTQFLPDGPYAMQIKAAPPTKGRRDIDNIIKATSDILVSMGVTPDDSQMQFVSAAWTVNYPGVFVVVRPCLPYATDIEGGAWE